MGRAVPGTSGRGEQKAEAVADNEVRSQQEKNNQPLVQLYIRTYVHTYIVAYITLTDNIQCMYIHTSQTADSSKLSADTEHRVGAGVPSVLNRVNLPQSTAARGRSSKTR